MKFFVRKIFTKLLLLSLLTVPLVLFAMNEFKQIAQAAGGGYETPQARPLDQELKNLQARAAKLHAMPADLHKELIYPAGGTVNKATPNEGEYENLITAVGKRAQILQTHRSFLEYCDNVKKNNKADFTKIFGQKLDGLDDLKASYDSCRVELTDGFNAIANIIKLSKELAEKEAVISRNPADIGAILSKLKEARKNLAPRWERDNNIVNIDKQLTEIELALGNKALMDEEGKLQTECSNEELAYRDLEIEKLTMEVQESTIKKLNLLGERLDDLQKKLGGQVGNGEHAWIRKETDTWKSRGKLLPKIFALRNRMINSLEETSMATYLGECAKLLSMDLVSNQLVRRLAEDFCTKYLMDYPKNKKLLVYDTDVLLLGSDGKWVPVPRKYVYPFPNEIMKGRTQFNLEEPTPFDSKEPPTVNPYTEFDAMKDPKLEKVSLKEEKIEKEIRDKLNGKIPPKNLKPTPKNEMVHFYLEQSKTVTRWNAIAITKFHAECNIQEHRETLGEVWERLDKLAKVIKDDKLKELFPMESK